MRDVRAAYVGSGSKKLGSGGVSASMSARASHCDIFRRGYQVFWVPIAAKPHRNNQARYSITSSARASSIGEISSPSALAVFRLMTVWYLTGPCTGRSAGCSPLRMRST
jgi:hypothetical protein